MNKIVVIGAGAAGLMAAGQAAEGGASVVVLEKMKLPGRKLCLTGKGRCNLTNTAEIGEFLSHFGKTGVFLRSSFSRFFNHDLMRFFREKDLELVEERGGRVFPASDKASDVLKSLLAWLKAKNVEIQTSSRVSKLVARDGKISGVVCNEKLITADAVILATGGASYPATGSTGDGYILAKSLGHTVSLIRPALVALEVFESFPEKLADLTLKNCSLRLLIDGKKVGEAFGELLFTDFGVSGPTTLKLSGMAVDALIGGQKVEFSVDFKPALDENKLDARILRDIEENGKKPVSLLLQGLLPKRLVPICLDFIGVPGERQNSGITGGERRKLRGWLKDFRFAISRHRPFSEAIITAGGIPIREVNPKTMESAKIRNLFLAGEILDVQADTGGYNLQAAFSTGFAAGRAAASADLDR